MLATVVDLRYNMKEVLKAIERNEKVVISYHGKEKAILTPIKQITKKISLKDHPAFGVLADNKESVEDIMKSLRGGRYHDI